MPVAAYAAAFLWSVAQRPFDDDPWSSICGYRMNAADIDRLLLDNGGDQQAVVLTSENGQDTLVVDGRSCVLEDCEMNGGNIAFSLDGMRHNLFVCTSKGMLRVFVGAQPYDLKPWAPDYAHDAHHQGSLNAPMPGVVTALSVDPGTEVKKGEVLLVMEAMKMEHAIEAPVNGTLNAHRFKVGDQLQQGDLLVDFTPAD